VLGVPSSLSACWTAQVHRCCWTALPASCHDGAWPHTVQSASAPTAVHMQQPAIRCFCSLSTGLCRLSTPVCLTSTAPWLCSKEIMQPEVPHSLRLQGILVGGVVVVYSRQQGFLLGASGCSCRVVTAHALASAPAPCCCALQMTCKTCWCALYIANGMAEPAGPLPRQQAVLCVLCSVWSRKRWPLPRPSPCCKAQRLPKTRTRVPGNMGQTSP
jgi:hypothetical protein